MGITFLTHGFLIPFKLHIKIYFVILFPKRGERDMNLCKKNQKLFFFFKHKKSIVIKSKLDMQ